jgi:hypothetical protein
MIQLFAPDWFTRADILIEAFSFLVLFTFFIVSIKNYKLTKNKKLLILGVGFLFISLAELSTILTKFILYYKTMLTQNFGNLIVKYSAWHASDLPYDIGFFTYKLFTLIGLYIIYRLHMKNKNLGDLVLSVFFIIIASVAGQSMFYIFHLTTLVLLVLIIINYAEVYKNNKNINTKMLIISFIILALGNALFIMSPIRLVYVAGQLLQLFGYIIFLFIILKIYKNGWTKRK